MRDPDAPLLSILIEWENILLTEDDRCLRMLGELGRQVGACDCTCEILVLHNPEQIAGSVIAEILATHLVIAPDRDRVTVKGVPSPGLHYYDLRNHGVRVARGEIIVCLDSDVIPEPGWLDALTTPLREIPSIDFVAGETHLDHSRSYFDRCFALGWIFPPRSPETTLGKANGRQFWANNMACRRSFFLRHPYPAGHDPLGARNACRRLKDLLAAEGIEVWHASGAKVSHPAPDGWPAALRHARVEGRDNAILYAERGYGRVRRSLRAVEFARGRLRQAVRNARAEDSPIRTPVWRVPCVILVLLPYYLTTVAGAWGHAWLPERVWRRWDL